MDDEAEVSQNEEETDLFKGMIGEFLSKEQYSEWKLLRQQAGDLVSSDDDETYAEVSVLDYTAGAEVELVSTSPVDTPTHPLGPMFGGVEAETVGEVSHATGRVHGLSLLDLEHDITTKILSGDIKFAEFSEMMERLDQVNQNVIESRKAIVTQGVTEDIHVGCQTQATDEPDDNEPDDVDDDDDNDGDDDNDSDFDLDDSEDDPPDLTTDDEEWTPQTENRPKSALKIPKKLTGRKPSRKKTISPKLPKPWSISPKSPRSPRKLRKKKRKMTDLPKHMQGLMGQAHLKFARGEHEEAVKMCLEVIRLAPMAAEPFQTLGLLYEESGDMQKSLQFSLIAAHLRPEESEEWGRLAEISVELGEIKQAVTCYSKALKYDPKNVSYAMERCALLEQLKDQKRVLEGFHYILKILPKTEGDKYLQVARDMAKAYHENGEADKAIETLQEAFKQHFEKITSEDVNLLLELQLSQKMYKDSLQVLVKHCGVVFHTADQQVWSSSEDRGQVGDTTQLVRCVVSEWLPVDLRVKLAVCSIHLEMLDIAKDVLGPLLEEPAETNGDLYLDVVEAYMETNHYAEAKPILESLINTENYGLAAVWLRYAECLSMLGDLEGSERAYGHVVELAPNHTEARVALSNLLQQMGRTDDALQTLSKEILEQAELTPEERWLLLHKCMMLYSQKKYNDFVDNGKRLVTSYIKKMYHPSYLRVVLSYHTFKHRNEALRLLAKTRPDVVVPQTGASTGNEKGLSKDELWDIFVKLFDVMVEVGRLEELQELAVLGLTCPLFTSEEDISREVEDLCLLAFVMNRNGQYAYKFVKEICMKEFDNVNAWNLFCQVVSYVTDSRHNRFCLRLSLKHPAHLPLGLLNGHNSMISGSFKHSLGEYANALRSAPNDPLIYLCIGLCFVLMASQKHAGQRHTLVTQGCCFLERYLEMRGECQESYYNLGRAMHQLDLKYAAVYYYKKALSSGPPIEDPEGTFDLKREIAHNLCLIYQESKSLEYARMILHQYLRV